MGKKWVGIPFSIVSYFGRIEWFSQVKLLMIQQLRYSLPHIYIFNPYLYSDENIVSHLDHMEQVFIF
jgi:hypothetical protein